MKFFCAIAMISLVGFTLHAQTNLPATNSVPRVTHIDSDRADFDLNARTAIYRGNVHVSDPEMKMTCERLVADLPQFGHINRIVAETNVVIDYTDSKNQVTHATGDKAEYNYSIKNGVTNETVTLTGNPELQGANGNSTGDAIIWDRIGNHLKIVNPKGSFHQNFNLMSETNSSPAITNQLSAPKTNLPTRTIEKIDKVLPATQNAP